MGKTYKYNERWKKDQRDKNFQKSKKYKNSQYEKYKPTDVSQVEPLIDDDDTHCSSFEKNEDY